MDLIYSFKITVALKYGDMDDFLVARMILCGIPLSEPYLQCRLLVLMREEMKALKEGRLPVSECYYLMGTVDPTGTLKPNEVCIILYVFLQLLFIILHKISLNNFSIKFCILFCLIINSCSSPCLVILSSIHILHVLDIKIFLV